MVAELVPGFRDTDFRDSKRVAFAAQTERGDASHIRLKSQHNQVIHRTKVIPGLRLGNVAVCPSTIRLRNRWQRSVQPGIGSSSANFCFPYGTEILLQATTVRGSHFCLQTSHFGKVIVQDAGFSPQCFPLNSRATFGFLKQRRKDLTAPTLCR